MVMVLHYAGFPFDEIYEIMNEPSFGSTFSPSSSMGEHRFRYILGTMEKKSRRSGHIGVAAAVALFVALANDFMPAASIIPVKMLASGLVIFGVTQLMRWSAYHHMLHIHDQFASPPQSAGPADITTAGTTTERASRRSSRTLQESHDEIRWFGSTSDAQARGWRFFEEYAVFAGAPVARFAEQMGRWHEYLGLADPDQEGVLRDPPEGTVRFGRLLYRQLSTPPVEYPAS